MDMTTIESKVHAMDALPSRDSGLTGDSDDTTHPIKRRSSR